MPRVLPYIRTTLSSDVVVVVAARLGLLATSSIFTMRRRGKRPVIQTNKDKTAGAAYRWQKKTRNGGRAMCVYDWLH